MCRPRLPEGQINLSDPDSRVMRSKGLPHRQAYNVQTAVTEQQIILAAEISSTRPTSGTWSRCSITRSRTCAGTGSPSSPRRSSVTPATGTPVRSRRSRDRGIEVLVPPDGAMREGKRPGWEDGLYEQMREKLETAARPHALRPAQDHDRAGLRPDQIQPAHRPVHAKRQSRRAVGVTVGGSDPQPAQAPQPLDRQHRLTGETRSHPRGDCSHLAQKPNPALSAFSDGLVANGKPASTISGEQSDRRRRPVLAGRQARS